MRYIAASHKLTPAEIGRALAKMREAASLTQRQVAERFGIDKSAVSSWEQARSSPKADKLLELDELYGADGALLALYGFSRLVADETMPDRVAKLEQRADRHAAEIAALLQFAGIALPDESTDGAGHVQQR